MERKTKDGHKQNQDGHKCERQTHHIHLDHIQYHKINQKCDQQGHNQTTIQNPPMRVPKFVAFIH